MEDLNESFEDLISRRFKAGIYSLSRTYKHELLWAHYASEHTGFCIEYDLETLVKDNIYQDFFHFSVDYAKSPPIIRMNDLKNGEANQLIRKLAGTKSKSWAYEEEIRIVSDEAGRQDYDYSAVESIYFGLRMPEQKKKVIMDRMKGRGINYYQINLKDDSYKYEREPVCDIYDDATAYLFEIPTEKNQQSSEYEIVEKTYKQYADKGMITVQLPKKITENQLSQIAHDIKEKVFQRASRVFMTYYLPHMKYGEGAWATTHYKSDYFDISIKGLTITQEERIINELQNETRNFIGKWIDETPFLSCGLVLYQKNGDIFLERIYPNGDKSEKQKIASQTSQGTRYDDSETNTHGEYIVVKENGVLKFYSPDGVFKTLKPF
ncbi:hypothetical protein CK503_11845 [Aliifodinibius salipaludis]|uniref:DUF2971 domain-containing protein n=1 Tax=Fodinibius salipaludis TaxID=2032627 RepID=A0A2A2G976_9BACT|nr:hypothetical protein CK503_11845 [Aliifodinibius salipaludis]